MLCKCSWKSGKLKREFHEERRLRRDLSEIIKEWKNEAGVEDIILIGVYADFRDTIKICTNKPGWMIGKGGELLYKYKEKLKLINPHLKDIEFIETDKWFIR